MEPQLLSKQDVADLARIGKRSVERLTSRGVLQGFKPAGMRCVRYYRAEVMEWIEAGCPTPARKQKGKAS